MERFLCDSSGTRAAFDADVIPRRQATLLALDEFPGTWLNADAKSPGLAKVKCSLNDGQLIVQAFGAGSNGLIDWGQARDVLTFGASATATDGSGLSCWYDFPHLTSYMQANLKGGVMVAVTYNTFTDASQRRPYYMREFLTLVSAQ